METVVSGIRSTGMLHLGNYFGALRNFTKMQHDAKCFFFIADYHSLTTHPDPTILHGNVKNILSEYLAAGLDPEAATIYIQSDVPEVAELSLLLGMHAYVGELERTASFKDKVRKNPNNVNIGLLNYPVLMASDILLHRADYVPVGKDQEQHLEMTRHLAHRFNQIYKTDFFNENVAPFNFGKDLVKMTMTNTPSVPQIFARAYNTDLCMIHTPLSNNEAMVALNLYAPTAGEYTLSAEAQNGETIYLLKDNAIVWDLTASEYTIDLSQGNTEVYGVIIKRAPQVETGVDNGATIQTLPSKVILQGNLYIFHNGQVYDTTGKCVK